jgi:hypothetical protein
MSGAQVIDFAAAVKRLDEKLVEAVRRKLREGLDAERTWTVRELHARMLERADRRLVHEPGPEAA